MGNAWDDDPDLKAMRASMRPPRGSSPWAGLFFGVALVACGTFAFAYYLPLYRAHQTLVGSHARIMGQIENLQTALARVQADLKSELAKRETLEAEKRQREASAKSGSGDTEALKKTLVEKLEKPIAKKQAAVGSVEGRVVLAVASGVLFAPGKLDVSPAGRGVLCDIAKAAGSRGLRVMGATDDKGVPASLKPKYPNAWTLSAAAAASAAETLESKCSVPAPRLSAAASADSRATTPGLSDFKLAGLRLEIEIAGEQK